MRMGTMLRHFEQQKDGGARIYTRRLLPLLFREGREHEWVPIYQNPRRFGPTETSLMSPSYALRCRARCCATSSPCLGRRPEPGSHFQSSADLVRVAGVDPEAGERAAATFKLVTVDRCTPAASLRLDGPRQTAGHGSGHANAAIPRPPPAKRRDHSPALPPGASTACVRPDRAATGTCNTAPRVGRACSRSRDFCYPINKV